MKKSDYKGLYESLNVNEDMKKQLKMLPHRQNHKKVYITATVAAIAVAALVIMQIVKRPSDIDISHYAAIINEQTQKTDIRIQMNQEFMNSGQGMGKGGSSPQLKYNNLDKVNLFNNSDHSIKEGVLLVDRFSKANDDNQMSEELIKDSIERIEVALGLFPEQRIGLIDSAIREALLPNREFDGVEIRYDNGFTIQITNFEVNVFNSSARTLANTTQEVIFQDLPYKTRNEAIAFAKHAIESISGKEYVFVEEDILGYRYDEAGYENRELIVGKNSYFKPIDDDGRPLSKLDYLAFHVSEDLDGISFNIPAYPTHEYVATYPLITYENAVKQIENGNHLTYIESAKGEPIAREDILASELVYYRAGQYTMPYYKFIIKGPYPYQIEDSDTSGMVKTYEIYVPAIEFEDIYADWQFKG